MKYLKPNPPEPEMELTQISDPPATITATGVASYAWRALGLLSVAIGIINAFIPLLPTTVFLIVGVWAFGKGAPEWRDRLLRHPRYGAPLRQWQDGGRISHRSKKVAILSMAASVALTALLLGLTIVSVSVGFGLALMAIWLWRRPEPR
ncbi:MAG: YbaN family protein [Burkholderiaceae bacterium]